MDGACLLILEDDAERLERFARVLADVAPGVAWRQWRDANRIIRECEPYLDSCVLICLDHDLVPVEGKDAGDGLQAAKFLAERGVRCPVLIHSSNGDRVRQMVGEFELAGIEVSTVLPLGEGWIERYWAAKVGSLLQR